MNRSLKRGWTNWCASVRYLLWTSCGQLDVGQSLAHHRHAIKLLQAGHCLEQKNDDTTTLDRLNRSRQQVWSDGLIVLENKHAERLAENLGRVLVVRISNVGDGDEELERILVVGLTDTSLHIAFNLGFALLAMAAVSLPHKPLDCELT